MADDIEAIKKHYNGISNKSIEERENTRNINIRKMNNFIKTCLIKKFIVNNDRVLDIGIGKGGDLSKYKNVGVNELYGIDIANKSILDAIKRFREGDYRFKASLKTKNGYSNVFDLHRTFDVVSIQFSFHYAFSSEATFDIAIQNISNHLKYDGYFIITIPCKNEILRRKKIGKLSNFYYKIEFIDPNSEDLYGNGYYYSLIDSVEECIEYLVDMNELQRKMEIKGFELIENTPFEDFFNMEMQYNLKSYNNISYIHLNSDEHEVFNLHNIVVFKKLK